MILAAHQEGTIDGAAKDMAKQAIVDTLVDLVACTDIVDVQVLDEMTLTVKVTGKRSHAVTYWHPNILFHIEVRSLLE